jgi:TldD protein
MDDLLKYSVDRARDLGAQYADARFQDLRQTLIIAENGSLRSYESDRSTGIGIRVLAGGAWGLASSTFLEKGNLRQMASEAVRMAKATRKLSTLVQLAKIKPMKSTVKIPVRSDPDNVPPDAKVKLLL